MPTLVDWVRRLLWRDDVGPPPTSGDSLELVLCVGVGQPASEDRSLVPDAWLFAASAREAVSMLGELAQLGTVERVTVEGLAELSPADSRELLRAARRLRCRGLWVMV